MVAISSYITFWFSYAANEGAWSRIFLITFAFVLMMEGGCCEDSTLCDCGLRIYSKSIQLVSRIVCVCIDHMMLVRKVCHYGGTGDDCTRHPDGDRDDRPGDWHPVDRCDRPAD